MRPKGTLVLTVRKRNTSHLELGSRGANIANEPNNTTQESHGIATKRTWGSGKAQVDEVGIATVFSLLKLNGVGFQAFTPSYLIT